MRRAIKSGHRSARDRIETDDGVDHPTINSDHIAIQPGFAGGIGRSRDALITSANAEIKGTTLDVDKAGRRLFNTDHVAIDGEQGAVVFTADSPPVSIAELLIQGPGRKRLPLIAWGVMVGVEALIEGVAELLQQHPLDVGV